jgi:hypothetical protein
MRAISSFSSYQQRIIRYLVKDRPQSQTVFVSQTVFASDWCNAANSPTADAATSSPRSMPLMRNPRPRLYCPVAQSADMPGLWPMASFCPGFLFLSFFLSFDNSHAFFY